MEAKKFDNFYVFDDGGVRYFLFVDDNKSILFDCGFGKNDVLADIKDITLYKPTVYLSHGDMDHAGGLKYFDECYLNKGDHHLIKDDIIIHDLNEGDTINIGQYHFEVIELAGHTYGSVVFLDRNKKLLLAGDSVQTGPIYMFGNHRNLDLYIETLKKLQTYKDDIKTIIACHHDYPIGIEYIDYCLEDAILLKAGKLNGTPHEFMPCQIYQGKYVVFYY